MPKPKPNRVTKPTKSTNPPSLPPPPPNPPPLPPHPRTTFSHNNLPPLRRPRHRRHPPGLQTPHLRPQVRPTRIYLGFPPPRILPPNPRFLHHGRRDKSRKRKAQHHG
ncbi:hypothetical protein QC764_207562 [Podospora pseudoanserina]|uniref:Uncharacterized protein n=1 Tax=Podospora pseudoanserina TaxID=2609844 RepID=A0ABR0IHF4_9PEZI|nr:hypothetical protein QC764_207562 [Podospora pseudoanserina]